VCALPCGVACGRSRRGGRAGDGGARRAAGRVPRRCGKCAPPPERESSGNCHTETPSSRAKVEPSCAWQRGGAGHTLSRARAAPKNIGATTGPREACAGVVPMPNRAGLLKTRRGRPDAAHTTVCARSRLGGRPAKRPQTSHRQPPRNVSDGGDEKLRPATVRRARSPSRRKLACVGRAASRKTCDRRDAPSITERRLKGEPDTRRAGTALTGGRFVCMLAGFSRRRAGILPRPPRAPRAAHAIRIHFFSGAFK
jgi:hypothetical protein